MIKVFCVVQSRVSCVFACTLSTSVVLKSLELGQLSTQANHDFNFFLKILFLQQNLCFWCFMIFAYLFVGYPRHASGFSPLLWLSEEQGYSEPVWVKFFKGAQIHMVCATWICHWPGNCFGSWCLDSLTSTCTSLSGNSVFFFLFLIIISVVVPTVLFHSIDEASIP